MSASLITAYHSAEDYFFRSISSDCLDISDTATAYMTGVPVRDLNIVYIRNNKESIETILSKCKKFYDQHNLLFVAIVPEDLCPNGTDAVIHDAGYHQAGKSVAMALDLKTAASGAYDGAEIRANDDKLYEWMIPMIESFESTFSMTTCYADAHKYAQALKSRLYHYNLYENDKPITSITLSVHGTVARIDDVGTIPEHQRKGHATCLVNFALAKAKELGASHCFLEASESGLSIYQKLGFFPLFTTNIFSYALDK
ncbi:MAG: GNAT family N-acetyltransferase [Pseudomonadota bacterium]